jgi:two-component system, NarL family, response regulator DevR
MIRVIIVDDHPVVRRGLKQIITAEQDMQVAGEAENAREALCVIRRTACDAGGSLFRLPIWRPLYMLPSYYDVK